MASASPSVSRSPEQCQAWLQRVHEVQFSRMTPQQREAVREAAERAREHEQRARRCKAMTLGASRSYALAKEGLRQMSAASSVSPAAAMEASARYAVAQQASEAHQERMMTRWSPMMSGPQQIERAVAEAEEELEEAEALHAVAGMIGSPNIDQMRADLVVASAAPVALGGRPAPADTEVEALLGQLRKEPTEADEVEAKFKLYETYGEQVEKIRKLLFGFYEESRPTVPHSVGADMDRQIKKVDSPEAMGVPDDDGRVWFVYHMMRQAEQNNRSMAAVLDGFEKKLEMLAKNDQTECPVCLEAFTEGGVETLSCCHKLCKDCWGTWMEVTRGRAFCPLCRHDEFIGFVSREASGL